MEIISQFDYNLLFFIQHHLIHPILTQLMIFVSFLGNKGGIWIAISLLLMIRKETRFIGWISLASLLLATAMGEGLIKHIIERPRPYSVYPDVKMFIDHSTPYSFPSGHTTSTFAVSTVLARFYKKYAIPIWAFAFTMAFSRLYLFMHFPTDVIAGMFLGIACAFIVLKIAEDILNRKAETGR